MGEYPIKSGPEFGMDGSASRRIEIPLINIVLFLLTVLSTMFFGSYMVHYDADIHRFWIYLKAHPSWWLDGLPFSITLLAILFSHEMGHYLFSRYHRVPASLPYFIPAPNLVGTFGAVIFMKGRIRDRRALLDIGSAGPLSGFVVSLFAMLIGIKTARVVPLDTSEGMILFIPNFLMSKAFQFFLPELGPQDMIVSPILDASWVGFFVTMLNLLPIGQLDGGHIAYASIGRATNYLSWVVIVVLFIMGGLGFLTSASLRVPIFWEGWLFFALFALILMGPKGIKHPPPVYPEIKLDWVRWLIVILTILVFILTFTPVPFVVSG